MKRVWASVARLAVTGVLATGTGMMTGVVSAEPADLLAGQPGASGTLLIAWVDLKGKPPYKRYGAGKRDMEKGQFARFEEKPDEAKSDKKPITRGVRGSHPPFKRNR